MTFKHICITLIDNDLHTKNNNKIDKCVLMSNKINSKTTIMVKTNDHFIISLIYL